MVQVSLWPSSWLKCCNHNYITYSVKSKNNWKTKPVTWIHTNACARFSRPPPPPSPSRCEGMHAPGTPEPPYPPPLPPSPLYEKPNGDNRCPPGVHSCGPNLTLAGPLVPHPQLPPYSAFKPRAGVWSKSLNKENKHVRSLLIRSLDPQCWFKLASMIRVCYGTHDILAFSLRFGKGRSYSEL